ncbi:hypothetical protein [Rhodococcus kronopolitis]|uniref:Uncharacterized protein n=1 Tax=Rhodococcus kronopolitis TaxID=1460226 RepID=A0ABV9FN63_9NOCA
MPPTRRHTVARLAVTAAATALLATGVTGIAAAQSAVTGSAADTTRATTTHDNLTVTHEIIGNSTGYVGDEVHYRTTVSATDGPARQVTGIDESIWDLVGCTGTWMTAESGTVTYTNDSGERVTESMRYDDWGNDYPAVGSWTVDPAAGTTVTYDTVHEFRNAREVGGVSIGCEWAGQAASPSNIKASLTVHSDGLEPLDWRPTGVTVTCALGCLAPSDPAGSMEAFFGS